MIYWPFDSIVSDDGEGNLTYDREFNSENLRKIFSMLYTNGIAISDASAALQVVPGSGMAVTVNAGAVIIEGAMGKQEEPLSVSIDAASGSYARVDTIVARLNTNISGRSISIECIKGAEASEPSIPAIVRSGGIYDLRLANIRIPAGAAAITASMITDTRLGSECGVATARPQKVDTTAIFDQYQESLNEYMEYVRDCINETVAGNLQSQIETVAGNLQSQITDIQDPTVDGSLARQVERLSTLVTNLQNSLNTANKMINELAGFRDVKAKGFKFNNANWTITYVYCVGKHVTLRGSLNGSWNTGSAAKISNKTTNTVKLTMPKGYANLGTVVLMFGYQGTTIDAPLHFNLGVENLKTNGDGSIERLVQGFATGLKAGTQYQFQIDYIRSGNVADLI